MTATTIADNISKMLFYIFHLLNFVLSICDNDFFFNFCSVLDYVHVGGGVGSSSF